MFNINFKFKRDNDVPMRPPVLGGGEEVVEPSVNGGFTIFGTKKNGALAISAVYAAVEMISNSIAVLPVLSENKEIVKVFDETKQGKFMFIKCLISDMLLYGNGYAYIIKDATGHAVALRYISAQDVTIFYDKQKDYLVYNCSLLGGKVAPEEMIHIYKNSKDGVSGIGVLHFAARSIDLSNYTEDAAVDYYKDGLNISALAHAKQPMTKVQAQQALQSLQGNIETGSGKKIKFVPFDIDFNTLTTNAKDAALVESRLYNITEVARYFCISPVLLQDLSHGSYSTIEAANLQFLTQTLLPYIFILETEFNKKMIPAGADYRIDLDETALLRTDAKSTAEYYSKLCNDGIISINEAREALGYETVEGGDKIVKAYTKVEDNVVAESK